MGTYNDVDLPTSTEDTHDDAVCCLRACHFLVAGYVSKLRTQFLIYAAVLHVIDFYLNHFGTGTRCLPPLLITMRAAVWAYNLCIMQLVQTLLVTQDEGLLQVCLVWLQISCKLGWVAHIQSMLCVVAISTSASTVMRDSVPWLRLLQYLRTSSLVI